MTLRVLSINDLDNKQFVGVMKDGSLELHIQLSKEKGNLLETKNDGLYVPDKSDTYILKSSLSPTDFEINTQGVLQLRRTPLTYTLTYAAGKDRITTWNPVDHDNAARHQLEIVGNLGIIHMDFKVVKDSGGSMAIFDLPSNAPTSPTLKEVQTHDGGSIWLNANSRRIMCGNLKAGTRYIVDIVILYR